MSLGQIDSIELEGIEDGKVPKSRLSDPLKACSIVDTLIRANAKRADVNSRVKGQLDGNPPYDPAVLKRNSQSHRTNVNFREAEGIHNSAVSPFYDLFAESPWYCEVQTDHGEEYDRIMWSKIITEEHDRMLKSWKRFNYTMEFMINDRTDFGTAFLMFPDDTCWRPEPVKESRVLVPDDAMASIDDEQDVIVVREACSVVKLWEKVKDEETAKAAGWDREWVLREMYYATPEGPSKQHDTDFYEWYQQQLRNNDISESVRSTKVCLAHLLIREYDGKISHFIVPEKATPKSKPGTPGTTSADTESKRAKFLFQRIGQYESFRQVLAAFFYDIGDGTWHSVKGLLVKMYPFIALKDRLNGAVIDNGFLNMSVLVQAETKAAIQDLQILQLGYLTVLPPDLKVQQWGIAGRMEEGLAVERHLENKLAANIGQYRQTARKEDGNPETATKVMADQSKEAMLSKSAVNRFYGELDFFYEEEYRRASNPNLRPNNEANRAALDFQKRCKQRGVPPEAITKVRSVRAYRNIGNGSIFMRQAAFRDGAAIVPMLNEEGRQHWLDDAIATIYSQDMVSRYNPQPKEMVTVADQSNLAIMENAAMKAGTTPMVTPTQNHVVHGDIHLKMASDAAQSVGKGANPMMVLGVLEIIGPHVLMHLQQIQNDPTREKQFKALEATYKNVATFTDQLRGQVQQMQKQQMQQRQAQQQAMTAEQMAQAKTQSDIARKDRKAQVDMATKAAKSQQQLAIAGRKAQQQEAVKDIQTAKDIQREDAKAEAKAESSVE